MAVDKGVTLRILFNAHGVVAQLGEHLVCNQKVVGSSPIGSS